MDKEIIIYIIFLIIALLGRLLGGNKDKKARPKAARPSQPQRPVKTFEELLEEFTSGKSMEEEEEVIERPEPVRPPVKRKRPEELILDEDEEPFSYEAPQEIRSLDEIIELEKLRTRSNIAVEPERKVQEDSDVHGIRELLKDPESARKAIILSEILNRKYH